MSGTAIINDGVIEAMMRAALYEEMKNEVASAPSDGYLDDMFPDSSNDKRLLRRFEKREKRREKRLREPAPAVYHLKRAAVVVMVMISVFTALIMTSTEVR
ncbi:MAG: hypothetical protein IJT91_02365, partial [Clostridia bacterium]|nr:hypothetical protein [Clostridia bacterium]